VRKTLKKHEKMKKKADEKHEKKIISKRAPKS